MRTAIAVAVSSLTLLACIAAPAGATPSPPPAPQQDSVVGRVTANSVGHPGEIVEYIISASSGPSGENPTGSVAARINVLPPQPMSSKVP